VFSILSLLKGIYEYRAFNSLWRVVRNCCPKITNWTLQLQWICTCTSNIKALCGTVLHLLWSLVTTAAYFSVSQIIEVLPVDFHLIWIRTWISWLQIFSENDSSTCQQIDSYSVGFMLSYSPNCCGMSIFFNM